MLIDGSLARGSIGLDCIMRDDLEDEGRTDLLGVLVAENSYGLMFKLQVDNEEVLLDNLTGRRLDPALVKAARKLEMDYVKSEGLWLKQPTEECFERTGTSPVSVRWVDMSKEDNKSPNVGSR